MTYFVGLAGLIWMTLLYWVFAFPMTVPIMLVGAWMVRPRESSAAQRAVPRVAWAPAVLILITYGWGAAFIETTGQWNGWRWPGLFGVAALAASTLIAWVVWQRAARDRRVGGILLMQLWFGVIAAWVVAAAVSPGSGLGAM